MERKKLYTKIDNVFLLAIVAFLSISIPSMIMVYADGICIDDCKYVYDTYYGDGSIPSKSPVRYGETDYYYNPDDNGNYGGAALVEFGGLSVRVDPGGELGMPAPLNEDGTTNTNFSIWTTEKEAEWDNYMTNGGEKTKFCELMEEGLKEAGYVNADGTVDIDGYIKHVANTGDGEELHIYPGIEASNGPGTNRFITTKDMDSEFYKNAKRGGLGQILENMEGACATGYHGYGDCGNSDDAKIACEQKTCEEVVDDPELCNPDTPLENLIKPPSCNYEPVDPTPVEPRTPPESFSSGGTCGGTYISANYSISTTACGYIDVLTTTTTVAKLPGMGGTVLAGKTFNFQDSTQVSVSSSSQVYDQSRLINEMAKQQSIINKIKSQIQCSKDRIDALTELLNQTSDALSKCQVRVQVGTDKDGKPIYDTSCPSSEIASLNQRLTEIENAITAEQQNLLKLASNTDLTNALNKLDELNTCSTQITIPASSSSSYTADITANMTIGDYSQGMNSIKGILKGSGDLLTQTQIDNLSSSTYIPVSDNFVVPVFTKNGSNGSVNATVTGLTSFSCPFNAVNYIKCDEDGCEPDPGDNPISISSGGLSIIYRPISLTNPFPNEKNTSIYRQMGLNWNENLAESVIKNNRGVNDYEVYSKQPLYTITLTPSTLKEIRAYNKQVSYNNFDMNCTNGYLCSSNFLWRDFRNIISEGESCATENGWDNCYGGGN